MILSVLQAAWIYRYASTRNAVALADLLIKELNKEDNGKDN